MNFVIQIIFLEWAEVYLQLGCNNDFNFLSIPLVEICMLKIKFTQQCTSCTAVTYKTFI